MCSGTHTEWNPSASAAWAKSRAYAGPNRAEPSNACTRPISVTPIGGTVPGIRTLRPRNQ